MSHFFRGPFLISEICGRGRKSEMKNRKCALAYSVQPDEKIAVLNFREAPGKNNPANYRHENAREISRREREKGSQQQTSASLGDSNLRSRLRIARPEFFLGSAPAGIEIANRLQ